MSKIPGTDHVIGQPSLSETRPHFFVAFTPRGSRDSTAVNLCTKNAEKSSVRLPGGMGAYTTWNCDAASQDSEAGNATAIVIGRPRLATLNDHREINRHSFTQSLLEQYIQTGDEVLGNVRGEFALVIIDITNKRCVLATDHFGIEPLYYRITAGRSLLVSSDLGLLAKAPGASVSISLQAIFDYSYFHVVPSPLTIFQEVFKLPPSHRFTFNLDNENLGRYWHPGMPKSNGKTIEELKERLFGALRHAVGGSIGRSSVGAYLSGGLDSSTVCRLLNELTDDPASAVTVGFDVEGYDEVYFARIVAEQLGLKHIVHYMSPEQVADSIERIASGYGEPFGNSSVIPAYFCALAAKENGINALLAGDGGDELFAGNTRYTKQLLFESYFKVPKILRSALFNPSFGDKDYRWHVGPLAKLSRYIQQANIPLPDRMQTFNILEMQPISSIFTPDFLALVDSDHPRFLWQSEYNSIDADPLTRMLYCDWRFALADNDLRKVKRTSELVGIDVEFPFLAEEVVDVSIDIPPTLKIKRLQLRYFYKKAMADFLPKEIINKEKHGFGLPFGEWLKSNARLQALVCDALSDLRKRQIFRDEFIHALLNDHRESHAGFYGNMVWVLAMLEWWLGSHRQSVNL